MTPLHIALALIAASVVLSAAGVYLVAGPGWACLAVAAHLMAGGLVLLRGALKTSGTAEAPNG